MYKTAILNDILPNGLEICLSLFKKGTAILNLAFNFIFPKNVFADISKQQNVQTCNTGINLTMLTRKRKIV